MKFCGHRNLKTIVGYYLDDISNIDSAASYLGLEQRRDLIQDFRSASMKRNPDLRHSLPARERSKLKQRRDFIKICKQIDLLSTRIIDATIEKTQEELTIQRRNLYNNARRSSTKP
jgi:hypothetical protein